MAGAHNYGLLDVDVIVNEPVCGNTQTGLTCEVTLLKES